MSGALIDFLISSGIAISLFVLINLLKQKGTKLVSRRIAMLIQLLWITRFVLFYLKPVDEPLQNATLIMYDQTLFFLDGLMVWLYVRALLRPDISFRRIWLHFIPFGFVFTYSTWAVIFQSEEVIVQYNKNIELLLRNESALQGPDIIYMVVLLSINIFYVVQSVRITTSYNKRLKENLSTVDNLTINWVRNFQNLWIILFVVPIIIYFFNDIYRFTEHLSLGFFIVSTFVVLSVVFNFYLLQQVYKPVSVFKKSSIPQYQDTNTKQEEQLKMLQSLLATERYYLNDELSLGQLAAYMDLKPSELTELIKYSPYENFYDLINSYRVEAVKKELIESNEQIIQLAYQNGFRSKSTFNKIFKEKTGMTPKAYRVSLK